MTEIASLFARIGADITGLASGLTQSQAMLRNASTGFTDAGKAMTLGLTLPIVGMGVAALSAAINYETAFTGVLKTVGEASTGIGQLTQVGEELRQGFLNLSAEIPVSANELASIGEMAGQLGVQAEGILDFTSVIAQLAVTTNLSSEEAATSLARFMNIMGTSMTDVDRLGSTIVGLGNNYATTETEIVNMGLRLAGVGQTIGLTEPQVLGLAAQMSSLGIAAESGGTAMSRILVDMASAVQGGGEELEAFAMIAGITSKEFTDAWAVDPLLALDALITELGKMSEEGENVFGAIDEIGLSGIRTRDVLLRLAGSLEGVTGAIAQGEEDWEQNIALSNEAELRFGTLQSKLDLVKNRFTLLAIKIGEVMIPRLIDLLENLDPIVERFAEWAEENPEELDKWLKTLGAIALLGPSLWVVGKALGFLATIVGGVGKAFLFTGGTAKWFAAGGLGPLGLAILLLLLVMWIFRDKWEAIWTSARQLLELTLRLIGRGMANLWELIKLAWIIIKGIIERIVENIVEVWNEFWGRMIVLGAEAWNELYAWFTTEWLNLKILWELKVKDVREVWELFWEDVSTISSDAWIEFFAWLSNEWLKLELLWEFGSQDIRVIWKTFWEAISTESSDSWNEHTSWLDTKWEGLKIDWQRWVDDISSVWSLFWETYTEISTEAWDTFLTWLDTAWQSLVIDFSLWVLDILMAIQDFWGTFKEIGGNLVDGLKQGMQNSWGSLVDWVNNAVERLLQTIRSVFSVFSPSGETHYIGEMLIQGMINGMQSKNAGLENMARKLGVNANSAFDVAPGFGGSGTLVGAAGLIEKPQNINTTHQSFDTNFSFPGVQYLTEADLERIMTHWQVMQERTNA